MNIIPVGYRERILRKVGKTMKVTSLVSKTPLGTFEGSIDDYTIYGYLLKFGSWAPGLQSILLDSIFALNRGTFIDIGANIGLTTIPLTRERNGVDCFAFEPDPDNFAFLSRNLTLNGVEKAVQAFNYAIFSEPGTMAFEKSDTNMGDHRVRVGKAASGVDNKYDEHTRTVVSIEARRLDDVLGGVELKFPVVVKIDTQGAEVKVFKGGQGILDKADYLIAEYWPYGLRRMGDSVQDFISIARRFPYAAQYADEDKARPVLVDVERVIERMLQIPDDGSDTENFDLIFSRTPTLMARK